MVVRVARVAVAVAAVLRPVHELVAALGGDGDRAVPLRPAVAAAAAAHAALEAAVTTAAEPQEQRDLGAVPDREVLMIISRGAGWETSGGVSRESEGAERSASRERTLT